MTLPVNEIEFTQDTKERRQWFQAASFAHPAKMVLGLQIYLIEHYTKPGETILDPMAGSGTILVACALGRNVVCVELEKKFCKLIEDNWQKIKSLGPMLGCKMGKATILQGDARALPELLVDKCVFSPPFSEQIQDSKWMQENQPRKHRGTHNPKTQNPANIANLPYGEISAVISSPPFGEAHEKKGLGVGDNDRADLRDYSYLKTGTKGQIGDMPYADAVKRLRKHGRSDDKAGGPYGKSLAHPYSGAEENIGNLKSENYLEAMLQVYQGCHEVLRPGGLMVLVVKNFIRDKKIVRLDLDTIKLCEQAGFTLKERLKRKLTQQSFWRIIYQQRFPDAPKIECEDILIFQKT